MVWNSGKTWKIAEILKQRSCVEEYRATVWAVTQSIAVNSNTIWMEIGWKSALTDGQPTGSKNCPLACDFAFLSPCLDTAPLSRQCSFIICFAWLTADSTGKMENRQQSRDSFEFIFTRDSCGALLQSVNSNTIIYNFRIFLHILIIRMKWFMWYRFTGLWIEIKRL